jgi:hypothetical protein
VVHTLALAEALADLGTDVTVHAVGRGGDTAFFRPVAPSVAVRLAPLPDREGESVGDRVLRSIEALAAAVDPGAYDVVHAQDCISANTVPGAVRTVHHLDRFTTPELARCHERALVNPSAHVCVSAAVAAEHRGHGDRQRRRRRPVRRRGLGPARRGRRPPPLARPPRRRPDRAGRGRHRAPQGDDPPAGGDAPAGQTPAARPGW